MLIALMLAAAQAAAPATPAAAAPTLAAVALGKRLARTGTLAALLPLVIGGDIDSLLKQHATLSEADRATLRRVAEATARTQSERVLDAEGVAYAQALSETDLRELVDTAESPAARRLRAALPGVIAGAMRSAGDIKLKEEATAAFCRETGKLCVGVSR